MKRSCLVVSVIGMLLFAASVYAFENYDEAVKDGAAKRNARDYAGARASYGEATKLAQSGDQKASAYLAIAHIFHSREANYAEAMGAAQEVLKVADASDALKAEAQCRIGDCLYWLRKYPESIAENMKVMDMPGASDYIKSTAWRYIGHAYNNSGKKAEARDAFTKITELAAGDAGWKFEAYRFIGGSLRTDEKNYPAAREAFGKILELPGVNDSRRAYALAGTAATYADEGNFKAAHEQLDEAVKLQGLGPWEQSEVVLTLARVLLLEKKYPEAIAEAQKLPAVSNMPGSRVYAAWQIVAEVYEAQGKKAEAVLCMGNAFYGAGNQKYAQSRYSDVIGMEGVSPATLSLALAGLGRSCFDSKDYAGAKDALGKVIVLTGADPEAVKIAKEYLEKIEKGGN